MSDDVERWLRGLDDSSPARRAEAARALGAHRVPWVVRLLCRVLDDHYGAVRAEAADSLGRIGDPDAVGALVASLGDEDWRVRGATARALGRIGDTRTVDALCEVLSDEEYVRDAAADALAALGAEPLARAILAVLAGDPDAPAGLESVRAVGPLCRMVETGPEEARRSAIQALGRIGEEQAVLTLLGALADPDEPVRHAAADALVRIGEGAVAPLMGALADPEPIGLAAGAPAESWERSRPGYVRPDVLVALGAADAVGRIGDRRAVGILVWALAHPEDAVRAAAARSLGHLGGEEVVLPLIEILESGAGEARREAAQALGELGDPSALGPLAAALADRDLGLSWRAADALSRFGPEAVKYLLMALESRQWYTRASAARALGLAGADEGVEPLLLCLSDAMLQVRQEAAEALEALGDGEVARALAAALNGEPELLLGCNDVRALKPLLAILEDEEHPLLAEAADALGALGPMAGCALVRLDELSRLPLEGDTERRCRTAARQIRTTLRTAPAELEPASAPGGRGTELLSASQPEGFGTELLSASQPAGTGTEPEAAEAPPRPDLEPVPVPAPSDIESVPPPDLEQLNAAPGPPGIAEHVRVRLARWFTST